DRRISIELKGSIRPKRDVSAIGGYAAGRGCEEKFIDLAGRAITRLVEPHSAIHQGIVDDDLLFQGFAAGLDHRQIRPPALGRPIFIVFLSGAIATDGKRKAPLRTTMKFDLAGLFAPGQRDKAAPSEKRIDDPAKEDQQQAGVHDVYCHFRDAMALPKQGKAVFTHDALRVPASL